MIGCCLGRSLSYDTQSILGAGAWNCLFTWSSGQVADLSLIVVRTGLLRMASLRNAIVEHAIYHCR